MADKEKKAAQGSKVEKAATDESKAAAKVAKAAKGDKKSDKPNFFVRAGKGTKSFFKHFKGESKKIVWPDAKTVLKSTGVVILVVAIVAIIIYGIDQGLSAGVTGLKSLANRDETTTSAVSGDDHDHDHDHDEETTAGSSEEETTSKEDASSTEGTTGEETKSESSETSAKAE